MLLSSTVHTHWHIMIHFIIPRRLNVAGIIWALGPKTCKISVDFIQPHTLLIANISGRSQDVLNLKGN